MGGKEPRTASSILALPSSLLLATLYSSWETKRVALQAQPLAENRKELKERKGEGEEGRVGDRVGRGERNGRENTKQSWSGLQNKDGEPLSPATHSVLSSPSSPLPPLQGEPFISPRVVQTVPLGLHSVQPQHRLLHAWLLHQVIRSGPLKGNAALLSMLKMMDKASTEAKRCP